MPLPRCLARDHERHHGVRPIQILALRTFYLLMAAFVATDKSLWLAAVAWPLWRAGTLAGSPAEEMTKVFLMTPLLIAAVPWGYVLRHYVLPARPRVA